MHTGSAIFAGWAVGVFLSLPSLAQDPPQEDVPDIEELLNVQVSTLSRREQSLGDVPAALHVNPNDDLRRIGVTSIAESLRRTRFNISAVSARGREEAQGGQIKRGVYLSLRRDL